ncbi:alpha/beta fold hydrolase [Nocardia araoensis]|uniref:alpha/beta fold hydrolase n=1 Tax=Nocardia araoensis TaxID=228600 RepID=UPI0002FC0EA9|nr:alpha/beta hydrolase [Nocardia araoensis]
MSVVRSPRRRLRWRRVLLTVPALLVMCTAVPAGAEPSGARVVDSAFLAEGQYVDTAMARFHYRKAGEGPPLILLPGGSLWSYTYREIIPALATAHTVYAVDLPGSGYTTLHDPNFGYDMGAMSDALRQFMSAVGITRASVVAHSLNGSVAGDFAARHPEQIDRLVLIAPLVLDTDLNMNLRLMRQPGAGEFAASAMTEEIYVAGLRGAYAHPEILTDELADTYWTPLSRAENRTAMWKQPRNLDLVAAERESSAIEADTLILWGEDDHVVDPAQARPLAQLIPHSTLRIIPGAGHNVHEDDPAAVALELTGFLGPR